VNSTNQTQIENALNEACSTFVFSGYQLAAECAQKSQLWVGGKTSYWAPEKKVTGSTYFDLGSLTKVVATTSIIARLVDQGKLLLSLTLGDCFRQFKGTGYEKMALKSLLTHSAGLLAWYPFFKEAKTPLIDIFCKLEKSFVKQPISTKATYSDLGFLLLGEVLKEKFGPLEKLFEREVLHPLNLKGIQYGPLPAIDCAATEFCLERKKLAQGEVFDLNTVYLGHCSSHAGLFASAVDLLPWAREWLKAVLGNSKWLSEETAKSFVTRDPKLNESTWALGWDTKSIAFSSAGEFFSSSSFGHLGYPGTSVWIDPEREGIAILLTNRVHPSRLDERIKRFRPRIHNLLAKAWESHGN